MKKLILTLILIFSLTSCKIVPDYKYTVTYKKCGTKISKIVTFTNSWFDTKPYYDEDYKTLHLMGWGAFYHSDITPVGGITDVCSATIEPVEKVSDSILNPDINGRL